MQAVGCNTFCMRSNSIQVFSLGFVKVKQNSKLYFMAFNSGSIDLHICDFDFCVIFDGLGKLTVCAQGFQPASSINDEHCLFFFFHHILGTSLGLCSRIFDYLSVERRFSSRKVSTRHHLAPALHRGMTGGTLIPHPFESSIVQCPRLLKIVVKNVLTGDQIMVSTVHFLAILVLAYLFTNCWSSPYGCGWNGLELWRYQWKF